MMQAFSLFAVSVLSRLAHSYEVLNKLPLGMGSADIESIEYDATNQQYLIASWYFGSVIAFDESILEEAEYNLTDATYLTEFNGFPINIWRTTVGSTTFNNGDFTANTSLWRPAGMEIVNEKLYVVDFYFGRVAQWDIATATYSATAFLTNLDDLPANLDGLCHDPANPNMLYTTDFGYAIVDALGNFGQTGYEAVYAVNTDDWSWQRIYDRTTTVEGAVEGYTLRPNGCVVVDGVLYTVDSDLEQSQQQGWNQYDITTQQWSVAYDVLPETGGDGLVYIEEIGLFFTTDVTNGTLSKYDPVTDSKFEVVLEGLPSAADLTYNAQARVLAIPEVYTGFVTFVALDDSLFTTTTEYFTTTEILAETTDEADEPDKAPGIAFAAIGLFNIALVLMI